MDRGRRWLLRLTGTKPETPKIKGGTSIISLRLAEHKRIFPHSTTHPGLDLAIPRKLVLVGTSRCDVPARALAGETSKRGHRTRRGRRQCCQVNGPNALPILGEEAPPEALRLRLHCAFSRGANSCPWCDNASCIAGR